MNRLRILLIMLAFMLAPQIYSQQVSKVKPKKIVWVADGDTISISKAKTQGISVPSKLEIIVFLDSKTIGKFNKQKLEFRWYKQGPTRQVITNSFTREINISNSRGLNNLLSTHRNGLRKGAWKVQIESYADRKLLSYKGNQEFWINLK